MGQFSKAIPVEKWYFRLESIADESAALDAWHSLVRAQGWSPVGEPEIGRDGTPLVVGRIVRYPGLTVSSDIRDAIVVPR